MSGPCSLSYVVTTRNKLPFLREVMSRLTRSLLPDEEIVVVDAASTDGTVEYLEGLKAEGKIAHYISEPDEGEGHGYNKGIFLSRGELIKIQTDDDVYYYPGIQTCKTFMLNNEKIDALTTGAGITNWAADGPCHSTASDEELRYYRRWRETFEAFPFCCNGLMIRRSALPKLGLFSVRYVAVDTEYSLRITYERHRLAFYTGICWTGNNNPQSQSVTKEERLKRDVKLLKERYMGLRSHPAMDAIRKTFKEGERRGKKTIRGILGIRKEKHWPFPESIPESFEKCDRWLEKVNAARKGEFLIPFPDRP